MTRRITRAKQTVRDSGARFGLPTGDAYRERLGVVLHVLYLIFNEGYATTAGENLQRSDLTAEAIRLTRMVHRMRPDDDEVTGLLALMLLTDARRPARTDGHGDLVPMAEQDRSRWNAAAIREGVDLLTAAVAHRKPGPYQIQAAIGALHDEAPTAEVTDWVQIRALYEALLRVSDNPVVALNHVVAVAMAESVTAGQVRLAEVAADPRIAENPRFHAVSAHLLEMAGDEDAAREAYAEAARRSTSIPQQRYLNGRPPGWRETRRPPATSTGNLGAVSSDRTQRGILYGVGAYTLWGGTALLAPGRPRECARAAGPPDHLVAGDLRRSAPDRRPAGLVGPDRSAPRPAAACRSGRRRLGQLGTYIWAVNHGHVVETSLGYYINPILSILVGVIFLHERLAPLQGQRRPGRAGRTGTDLRLRPAAVDRTGTGDELRDVRGDQEAGQRRCGRDRPSSRPC